MELPKRSEEAMLVLSVTEMETRAEAGIGCFVDESSKEVSGSCRSLQLSLEKSQILGGKLGTSQFCTQPKTEKTTLQNPILFV